MARKKKRKAPTSSAPKPPKQRNIPVPQRPLITEEFEWKFSIFSRLPEFIYGATFNSKYFEDVKWRMLVYPDGESEEDEGFVSVFLCNPEEARNQVTVDFDVWVVGPNDDKLELNSFTDADYSDLTHMVGWGFAQWIDREELELQQMLEDDTLTIKVCISYKKVNAVPIQQFLVEEFESCRTRLKSLDQLIDNDDSDFTFIIGKLRLRAHKVLLKRDWPHFNELMANDDRARLHCELLVENHSYLTIKKMLSYVYTGLVELDDVDTASELLKAAEHFQLNALARKCTDFVTANTAIPVIDID